MPSATKTRGTPKSGVSTNSNFSGSSINHDDIDHNEKSIVGRYRSS